MKKIITALVLCVWSLNSGATPGDAAVRGGHVEQGAKLYRRGAEQGDGEAALKLGLLIESGSLRDPAYGAAGDWYSKGCDLGNVVACHNAGVGHEYGSLGLSKDLEAAQDLYRRAAERGYMQSQYNLGSLYANDHFADDVQGLAWLLSAQRIAKQCVGKELCDWILRDPPGHISKLRQRMSAEQMTAAEAQAEKWAAQK
jgi:hypothetical protein